VKQPGFAAANLGEELAVLNLASGSYLGFNATAAHLWRLLDQPKTLPELVAAMTVEFNVDEAQCRTELEALLGGLSQAGLIRQDE